MRLGLWSVVPCNLAERVSISARDRGEEDRPSSCTVVFSSSHLLTPSCGNHQDAVNLEESSTEGQGNENIDAVSQSPGQIHRMLKVIRGLDNAGKTTIVKRIMHEDVNSVSPTLGFIIKTIEYEG